MTILSIQTAGYILTGIAAAAFLAIVIGAARYDAKLTAFRAALRPGDVCRVKWAGEIVNARIVARHGETSFTVLLTNTRKKAILPTAVIYMP